MPGRSKFKFPYILVHGVEKCSTIIAQINVFAIVTSSIMVWKKLELWSMVPTIAFVAIFFVISIVNYVIFYRAAKAHNIDFLVDIDKCLCDKNPNDRKIKDEDLRLYHIVKMVSSFIQDASSIWLISLLIQEEADRYNKAVFCPVVAGVVVATIVCFFRYNTLRFFIPNPISTGLCVGAKGVYASAVILDTIKCLKYIQIPLSAILGCLAASVTLGFTIGVMTIKKPKIGLWVGSSIEFTRNCATASTPLNIFGNFYSSFGKKAVKNAGFYSVLAVGIFLFFCICYVSVEKWKLRSKEMKKDIPGYFGDSLNSTDLSQSNNPLYHDQKNSKWI